MAEPRTDRRVARTRNALMSAFVNLLLSRGYDDFTVEDIAAGADVGRSTFYLHFKSREDVLKASLAWPSSFLVALVTEDPAPDRIVPLLLHFQEQRHRNRAMFVHPLRALWVGCLAELIEPHLAATARHARPALPLPMIAAQIAETQVALIAQWLGTRSRVKPPLVAQALIATTRANLDALMGAPRP